METVVVDAKNEKVYSQLKEIVTQKKSAIILDQAPEILIVEQGSLWGVSPKTAKKMVKFQLTQSKSGTQIISSSALSSDYMKLTVVGCVFALVLAIICAWLSLDLTSFAASEQPSSWSWLVSFGGHINGQGALMLSNLAFVFSVFLMITLALEIGTVFYIKHRVDNFANEILKALPQSIKDNK